MKPVVLLDCDGPLADFTGSYLQAIEEVSGFRATHDDVDQWAIHKCAFFVALEQELVENQRFVPGQLKRIVDRMVTGQGFAERIKPHPEALDAVAKLQELADVHVVTSPWDSSPTWMYERLHWVHHHFKIPRPHVIQTGRKHLIRGDIFVDDKPSHVREWQDAWPSSQAVLFDMHHNRKEETDGLARAGWPFVLQFVADRSDTHHRGTSDG